MNAIKENTSLNTKRTARRSTKETGKLTVPNPSRATLIERTKVAHKSLQTLKTEFNNEIIEDEVPVYRPSPANFDEYFPWACAQLSLNKIPEIIAHHDISLIHLSTEKTKLKSKTMQSPLESAIVPTEELKRLSLSGSLLRKKTDIVKIETFYSGNNLTHIKFDKNRDIPRKMLKIMALIISFYPSLTKITINRGLDCIIIYEISKMLPFCNITEVILDDCIVNELNFHILLQTPNSLKHLSLARCDIGDRGVELICKELMFPLPASNTLCALYLPSNKITNTGAAYIAQVLRANRRLRYLNLASNRLTDEGVIKILSILKEFPLNEDEIAAYKIRYKTHLLKKRKLVEQLYNDMKVGLSEKSTRGVLKHEQITSAKKKRKSLTSVSEKEDKKKAAFLKKENENPNQQTEPMSLLNKAEMKIDDILVFSDPFSKRHQTIIDNEIYSNGNFYLSYVNVAYNDCSLLTIKKAVEVMEYQRYNHGPKDQGLVNICLEGNPLPNMCNELNELQVLVERCLGARSSRTSKYLKSATKARALGLK